MNERLVRLEAFAKQMIEGSLARLFGQHLQLTDVVSSLAHAIEDNARQAADGIRHAPDLYAIRLHPADHTALSETAPDLADQLAAATHDLAVQAGFQLDATPYVTIESDPLMLPHTMAVIARHSHAVPHDTQPLPVTGIPNMPVTAASPSVVNPQLILNGHLAFPLTRSVINVGRRADNHLVLDDQRVSRAHAQLRLRLGHYVVYDLNSTGGTLVNDQRITEHILRHGDVLSFAGVTAIYVEDGSGLHRVPTDTQMHDRRQALAQEEAAFSGDDAAHEPLN